MEDGTRLISYGTMFGMKASVKRSPSWDHVPDYQFVDVADAIARKVGTIILEHSPDLIVIEQTNQGGGKQRVQQKELEFIHYAVLSRLREIGCQYKTMYINSSSWRSLCEQKLTKEQKAHNKLVKAKQARGKITPKHLAVAWANKMFGLSLLQKDEDSAEAISIAYGGWKFHQRTLVGKINVDKIFSSQ